MGVLQIDGSGITDMQAHTHTPVVDLLYLDFHRPQLY